MRMAAKVLLSISLTALLRAQAVGEDDSRMDEIRAQRQEKSEMLAPEESNRIERGLLKIKDQSLIERFTTGYGGWRVKIGGLAQGAGLGFGPEYFRDDLAGGKLRFRAAAQTSFRSYQKYDMQVGLPRFVYNRFDVDLYAVHHNYPELGYYGPGADSEKSGRSDYRLEDTAVDATISTLLGRHFRVGSSAGYLVNNVGPGTATRFVSADQIYSPLQAPGISQQANFARVGAFAQYDYRDNPAGARSGGNYFMQWSTFRDQTAGRYDFRRLDLEAQQYIPLLNRRRVIALRAKSVLSFTDPNQSVPFYIQPMLGGSEDLRGFRPYRFRDDNLLVFNAEYRWQVFSGLDMALFGDAGKVAHRRSDLSLSRLEADAGFGFRFNTKNATFLRLDFGFSHEGFQVSFKFNNVFRRGPVHTSSSQGDF
jgi:outer membrane protein assembly factor BamA